MEGVTWLDDLKIRGGWGEMGNSNNVDPFNQFSLYRADRGNTFYPINGQNSGVDEGFAQSRIGNPDAKWETSETLNIGFDASMFNNRFEIIFDWWQKDTRDLLFQVPLPGVTGNYASAPAVNVGGMLNQGLDLQLVGRGNVTSDLTWELTLNGSILKNEITGLTDDLDVLTTVNPGFRGINPIRNEVGQPLSSFFGYNVIGYFSSQADVDSHAEQPGAGIGRFKYEDIDGDGAITPDDRTFLGDPIPDFTGGATLVIGYKNFTLDMYVYTSIGNEIWNQTKWFTDFFGTFEGSAKGVRAKIHGLLSWVTMPQLQFGNLLLT